MKNYGIDWSRELREQSPTDRLLGASTETDIAQIPRELRRRYLPFGEVQKCKEDTMDCASRAIVNIVEHKLNYLLGENLLTDEEKDFLLEYNFITEGGVELSDAYIAILSGTTRAGNSLKAPIQAMRDYGFVPKSVLPLIKTMTFDEYHDPARITDEIKRIGKESLKYFKVFYERIDENDIARYLETDIVNTAGFAWDRPDENGVYPRSETQPNHAFETFDLKYYCFDNYRSSYDGTFVKHLAPDYNFMDYGYTVGLARVPRVVEPTDDEKEMENLIERFVDLWIKLFTELKKLLRL